MSSVVRLMYQFQVATCSSILQALVLVGRVALSYGSVENEYRVLIEHLSKEGLEPAAIKQRLDGVYGEASPSYSTVKE